MDQLRRPRRRAHRPVCQLAVRFLYRGQRARYSPCTASIYRDIRLIQELTSRERDLHLLHQVRLAEFLAALEGHPAPAFAAEIGLHVNRVGVAQHYGMRTEYLDLTADPAVAVFFASCELGQDGAWHPAAGGVGIVYRIDWTAAPSQLATWFEPIGLQVFPRPGEQKAWALRLPFGHDFERWPVEAYTFEHNPIVGEAMLAQFDRGRELFPQDVLADLAQGIASRGSLSIRSLEATLIAQGCRPDRLAEAIDVYSDRFLDEFQVSVTEREQDHLSHAQRAAAAKCVDQRRSTFLKTVGVRAVIDPAQLSSHSASRSA